MRLAAVLLTMICLAACGSTTSSSGQALERYDDEWRQRQAALDAEVILEGMAQARQRREAIARTAR